MSRSENVRSRWLKPRHATWDEHQSISAAGNVEALASKLGVPSDQACRRAGALPPSVLGGMAHATLKLDTYVDQLGSADLARLVVVAEATEIDRGNQLLGGSFDSNNVSRQVAGYAARSSSLNPALFQSMLPILATLVAGRLPDEADGADDGRQTDRVLRLLLHPTNCSRVRSLRQDKLFVEFVPFADTQPCFNPARNWTPVQ